MLRLFAIHRLNTARHGLLNSFVPTEVPPGSRLAWSLLSTCLTEGIFDAAARPPTLNDTPRVASALQDPSLKGQQLSRLNNKPSCAPQPGAGSAPQELDRFRNPRQITAFIKHSRRKTAQRLKSSRPETALPTFVATMNDLLSAAGDHINVINIVSACTAIAQFRTLAQRNTNLAVDTSSDNELKALYKHYVQKLQPSTADMTAPLISNLLWSSAKVDLNPDEYVPGMVRALTHRFWGLINSADEAQHPDAQSCTNLVWALASMGHPAATRKLLNAACAHLACLMHSSDAKQHPNALHVSHIFWSLGKLDHIPEDKHLLDALCLYFNNLFCGQHNRAPTGYHVSMVAWSLAKLKHSPPEGTEAAGIQSLVTLCMEPGRQLPPPVITNFVHACAELRLSISKQQVEVLVNHMLGMHATAVQYMHYSSMARSLAVMDLLDMPMFDKVLHQLTSKLQQLEKQHGLGSEQAQLPEAARRQLHLAASWLKPAQDSDQMQSWSYLNSRLHRIAQQPDKKPLFPKQPQLYAALKTHLLPFQAQVPCGMFWADAVLTSRCSTPIQAILMLEHPGTSFRNAPSRLQGHAVFKKRMLERHGTVVTVPYVSVGQSIAHLAASIKAAVEAQTGLPLDAFRR